MTSYRVLARQEAATHHHRSTTEFWLAWPHLKQPKPAPPLVPDILRD